MNLPPIHRAGMLLLPGLTAWAQGTVNLNNNFTPVGSNSKAFIFGSNGQPMAKGAGRVEVSDMQGNRIREGGLGADGLFFLGVQEIPGTVPGGSGAIIIRAWEGPPGSTYHSAIHHGHVIVTLTSSGGGSIPPPNLGMVGNFTGLIIPPPLEPFAVLDDVQIVSGGVAVRGEGTYQYSWSLSASTNLLTWYPVGAPKIPGPEFNHPTPGSLQWTVPNPEAAAYFRIVLEKPRF